LRSLEEVWQETKEIIGSEKVAMLHGRMSSGEKNGVISDFKNSNIKLIVATVVIEVGLDLLDASFLLIEEADRFGLAQLHQLRGRIGRGGQESYCLLIADPKTEYAVKRLEALVNTGDGFLLAEHDMEIRGPGELAGLKQHGFLRSKFQNFIDESTLMEKAREEAFQLLGQDPDLTSHSNKELKRELEIREMGIK